MGSAYTVSAARGLSPPAVNGQKIVDAEKGMGEDTLPLIFNR